MSEASKPGDCRAVGEILERVGDKWTVLLLGALGDKRMRFKELHRAVDGISQRMLTVTLRHLERDGLLVRTAYPTIPPKVEYELSELGHSLLEIMRPVGDWVMSNHDVILASRSRFDARAQSDLSPLLIEE